MPVQNGVGFSEHTHEKQEHLAGLLDMHIQAATSVIKRYRYHPSYTYLDINAGQGINPNGVIGSPLVFFEQSKGIRPEVYLIEQDPANCAELEERVPCHWNVVQGNHNYCLQGLLPETRKDRVGLLYHDPTGLPSFDTLVQFSKQKQARMIDFLIYASASSMKRVLGAGHGDGLTLLEQLARINKRKWIVREPSGKHQWTFLFGANSEKLDFRWKKEGFVDARSAEGQEILDRLNYPESERLQRKRKTQLALFFHRLQFRMATRHIEAIVNI